MLAIGCRAVAVGIASATLAFGFMDMVDTKVLIILLSFGLLAASIMPLTVD